MPPVIEEEDAGTNAWILAIIVTIVVAVVIGAGAMIYRSNIGPSEPEEEIGAADEGPEGDDDDSSGDDDDQPPTQSPDEDEYEVLRYDMPSSRTRD